MLKIISKTLLLTRLFSLDKRSCVVLLTAVLGGISACNKFDVQLNQQHSEVWEIAGQKRECYGVAVQQCLLVKNKKTGEWENFYDAIEGFSYQEGFSYKLRIAVTPIEQPMADGSDRRYTLLDILEQSPAKPE